ncbi:hypothetical protein OOK41_21895 [Micromonospora sp. NBC_01655]|uniref:hypothetical protein n=1 Tax=Micromonospora sp. NBC_01655 TaxID=2975983 RepID=UPI00224E4C84|nr:hypothetical protein [Micromonospora sp. NBC_01655]MCX4472931.1 hypothetical protein [Micromonospora sp. NBC_01655]
MSTGRHHGPARRASRPEHAVSGRAGPTDGGQPKEYVELAVVRCPGADTGLTGHRLTGTWDGRPALPLAYAALR